MVDAAAVVACVEMRSDDGCTLPDGVTMRADERREERVDGGVATIPPPPDEDELYDRGVEEPLTAGGEDILPCPTPNDDDDAE